jgi:hypothetical protein
MIQGAQSPAELEQSDPGGDGSEVGQRHDSVGGGRAGQVGPCGCVITRGHLFQRDRGTQRLEQTSEFILFLLYQEPRLQG